jgi:hypothetical protein
MFELVIQPLSLEAIRLGRRNKQMSAEEVLTQIEHSSHGGDDFLFRFLSNLFCLFDNKLPPSIEPHIRELLTLLKERSIDSFEYRQTA